MSICLQCGKPAEHTETYQGIPIGTCEDGHRTGQALEEQSAESLEGSLGKKIAFAA